MDYKLLIIDWKSSSYYDNIKDIGTLIVNLDVPSSLDGMAGIIIHNPNTADIKDIIKKTEKTKMPIFLQGCGQRTEDYIRNKFSNEENLYFATTYDNLFNIVKETFDKIYSTKKRE